MPERLSWKWLLALGIALFASRDVMARSRFVYKVKQADLIARRTGHPILVIAGSKG